MVEPCGSLLFDLNCSSESFSEGQVAPPKSFTPERIFLSPVDLDAVPSAMCSISDSMLFWAIQIDGMIFKNVDAELTVEEREFITEVAPHVSIGTLCRLLQGKWCDRICSADLLDPKKAKGRELRFGADNDAINRFMRLGAGILSESGIFDIHFAECMKIEEVFVQKPSMKRYAPEYGNFTIVDSTFGISMYDLVLIIFSNVDCLMKTTLTGVVLTPSERSSPVISAARRFGLDNIALYPIQSSEPWGLTNKLGRVVVQVRQEKNFQVNFIKFIKNIGKEI